MISIATIDLYLQYINIKASKYTELRITHFKKCYVACPMLYNAGRQETVSYVPTRYCEQMNNDLAEI